MIRIGLIAIGRNEGERLKRCLTSCRSCAPAETPIIYVDSGSTDDSVAMAQNMGVAVVELDTTVPFTAARARNAGYDHLIATHGEVRYVSFMDGDCEFIDGWLSAATTALDGNDKLAAVNGRLHERHADASIYNRLCDMEWNTKVGPANAVGGNAVYRVSAFDAVGRFNSEMICGEEPELCVRLRAATWQIERLDADMMLHDAAMMRFSQWWKRSVRGGYAYAQGAALHGHGTLKHNIRPLRSIVLWGLIVPLLIVTLLWPTRGLSGLLLLGYIALAWKIKRYRQTAHSDTARDAWLYAAFCTLGKLPQALGVLRFHLYRMRGKQASIIEYKTTDTIKEPPTTTATRATAGKAGCQS